jgi:ubiquinone biosynthesis protein UbiJ
MAVYDLLRVGVSNVKWPPGCSGVLGVLNEVVDRSGFWKFALAIHSVKILVFSLLGLHLLLSLQEINLDLLYLFEFLHA